jgi:hypothetical protein
VKTENKQTEKQINIFWLQLQVHAMTWFVSLALNVKLLESTLLNVVRPKRSQKTIIDLETVLFSKHFIKVGCD